MGIAIVIIAVLYVTLDALDVLAAIILLLHFHFSFPLAVLCKRPFVFAVFSLSVLPLLYTT